MQAVPDSWVRASINEAVASVVVVPMRRGRRVCIEAKKMRTSRSKGLCASQCILSPCLALTPCVGHEVQSLEVPDQVKDSHTASEACGGALFIAHRLEEISGVCLCSVGSLIRKFTVGRFSSLAV